MISLAVSQFYPGVYTEAKTNEIEQHRPTDPEIQQLPGQTDRPFLTTEPVDGTSLTISMTHTAPKVPVSSKHRRHQEM
jgi:hypothetical protein